MRAKGTRRGSTTVMVGILLVAFLGVGAISADVGRFFVVTGEVQTAADAAALRGALKLADTPGSSPELFVDNAVIAFVGATNRADGKALSVTPENVRLAFYTPGTKQSGAQGTIDYNLDGRRANAVTVTLQAAPGGVFAQLLGLGGVQFTRAGTAWIAHVGSNCVRPWAFPYKALYEKVMDVPNAPTPAPDLDATKLSEFMAEEASGRFFTIVGQNQPTALENDGEWTGFNFTGNAGKASYVSGIQGCFDDKINPDAGQGVTLPGQADQYVNWSVQAVLGKGPGPADQDPLCAEKAYPDAGCYADAADTSPGVTINSAWGELLGVGSNGIDFDYVGEFVLTCFYETSSEICPAAAPGTPNTGYPPGTLVGYIKKLKSRYITPDDVLGNFNTSEIKIVLVK
jgi:Flp pilus assembly protein TadG